MRAGLDPSGFESWLAMPGASEAQKRPQRPVPLPTGTVTFLFTDIEGSTQRWEQHRDAMAVAVKRHDELLRSIIEKHDGFIFKTVGDAFCAAFARADDALAAAVECQRALGTVDFSEVDGLQVRMAIHCGSAHERDNDYSGPAVNRTGRLMSIGHGGQVLLSSIVQKLVGTNLPDGVVLLDLGLRRLKDLAEPEHVWQLEAPGLRSKFSPLNSLDEHPNNLPLQLTALIGREQDIDEVKTFIETHRLLTITGAGGVGKTRVALQAGADLVDRFADGVWFVDLAPISDPELVPSVAASALGLRQAGGRSVIDSITTWLKSKHALLILDNCEHLLVAAATLADAIHRSCPDVRMLATSRQPLNIAGETAHRLPSLATPQIGSALRAEEAMRYGAIAVFVDRAAMAGTQFVITDDNAAIIADICRHLDGIPFAIELAAARVKVLSIPNLAQRLNERFKILTGGSRTALPRQKTLGALIDWSYNLLSPHEQRLFNRMGVFAGGFGIDAVVAVCGDEPADEIEILDVVSSLADKSLVSADTTKSKARYRLLESTRAYALEKLAVTNERESIHRRHAEHFRDRAKAFAKSFGQGSTAAWLADVESELDNSRAALEWALTQHHAPILGAEIVAGLAQFWFRGGLSSEGNYWVESARAQVDAREHPGVVAWMLLGQSWTSSGHRTYELAQKAAELFESIGDVAGVARAHHSVTQGLFQMGELEAAKKENARALGELQACGDRWGIAAAFDLQGAIAYNLGDFAQGRASKHKALAGFRAIGDELGASIVADNLAEVEFADGKPQEAWRMASQAIAMASQQRVDAVTLAIRHTNGTAYQIALGDLDGAANSVRKAVRLARRSQFPAITAWAVQHFALILALRGNPQTAARLLGWVDAKLDELGRTRESTEQWSYEQLLSALREQLSDVEIEKLAAEGAAWSEDQAVEEALKV